MAKRNPVRMCSNEDKQAMTNCDKAALLAMSKEDFGAFWNLVEDAIEEHETPELIAMSDLCRDVFYEQEAARGGVKFIFTDKAGREHEFSFASAAETMVAIDAFYANEAQPSA